MSIIYGLRISIIYTNINNGKTIGAHIESSWAPQELLVIKRVFSSTTKRMTLYIWTEGDEWICSICIEKPLWVKKYGRTYPFRSSLKVFGVASERGP